jgi:hypothetical protein
MGENLSGTCAITILLIHPLTERKEHIINDHFDKMLDAHSKMLKQIDDAMRSYQTKGGGDVSIFEKIKLAFNFDRSKVLELPPEQMLEYSKAWFETARQNFNTIIQMLGQDYASLQKAIDMQIELAQQELVQVDQELKGVEDEPKKSWLQKKRNEIIDRSW